jgi:hypothetical protein
MRVYSLVLSLLVLLVSLPGAAQSGGWFCASGVQCEPAAAPTCCCGAQEAADDRCEQEPGRHHLQTVAALPCGCYYEAQALEPLLKAGRVVAPPAPALLPTPVAPLTLAVRSIPLPPPAVTQGPPGLFVSSQVTRGPPAA